MDFKKRALKIAAQGGFIKSDIQTDPFLLTSFQKLTKLKAPLTIYIEGDGRTWITRTKLSPNPTPHNPLALKLAVLDSSLNVVYLARPCQYTSLDLDSACTPIIWSDERFSKRVITAMSEAVTLLKQKTNATEIHLVGFSGGAAIAALIAAQRKDISTLRTVAGDLNHQALTEYHKTTPLKNSLNPTNFVKQLKNLPQLHFSAEKDTTVPPFIAENFVNAIRKNGGHCAKQIVLKGATHHQGWEQEWQTLLKNPLDCY